MVPHLVVSRAARGATLVLGALCLSACGGDESPGALGPAGPTPTVVVFTVEPRVVPIFREFVARTEAVETVEIQARVEAILQSAEFEEGTLVETGQVLFRLDPLTYQANLAAAEAEVARADADLKLAREQVSVRTAEALLDQAKAQLTKARQDVARLRPLAEQDAVPRQDLDTALAAEEVAVAEVAAQEANLTNSKIMEEVGVLQAEAQLKAAEASRDLAQLDLSYCEIASPLGGLIGRALVDPGNLVGRGAPTPLATVSSVDPMHVTFAISEGDFLALMRQREARVERGDEQDRSSGIQLLLTDDSLYEHTGTVVTADRAIDVETGSLQLVTSFPNPPVPGSPGGVLRPGQFGRVRVQVEELPEALLVPQRSIVERQGAKSVLVVGPDDQVVLRSVQVGERFEQFYVVTAGVEAGDRVIVEGQLKARPGMAVQTTDQPLTEEPDAASGEG